MFREWSNDQSGRREVERGPTGQGSLLLSLLGADWFKNLTGCLTHWPLNGSGQVLCLDGLFFFPFIFKLGAAWSKEWTNLKRRASIVPAQIKAENRLT